MSCYIYFIRTLRYVLVLLLFCSIIFSIDKEVCGGLLDGFLSRVTPRLAIEYATADITLEAVVDYVKADSTLISMRVLWTI